MGVFVGCAWKDCGLPGSPTITTIEETIGLVCVGRGGRGITMVALHRDVSQSVGTTLLVMIVHLCLCAAGVPHH